MTFTDEDFDKASKGQFTEELAELVDAALNYVTKVKARPGGNPLDGISIEAAITGGIILGYMLATQAGVQK